MFFFGPAGRYDAVRPNLPIWHLFGMKRIVGCVVGRLAGLSEKPAGFHLTLTAAERYSGHPWTALLRTPLKPLC